MPVAQIASIPSTPDDIQSWSFNHLANHRDIVRVILRDKGKRLDEYVLDFDPSTLASWLPLHQAMHIQMNQALGFPGSDLNSLDWQDPGSVASWFALHAVEHERASMLLKLG